MIEKIRDMTASRGSDFMIVSTPRFWIDPSPRSGAQPTGSTYDDLMNRLRSDELLVLDVERRPGFDCQGMVVPGDGHWNREGHAFVAREVHRSIDEHLLNDGGGPDAPDHEDP